MNTGKLILASLIAATLFFSCRPKPININVKPAVVKLVVSSSVIPNRIMLVSLTRSFSSLEIKLNQDTVSSNLAGTVLVKNAFVTVSYLGRKDTLIKIADGLYGSVNTLLANNAVYELCAKDNDTGLEVTASTYMLPYHRFDSIRPYKLITAKDTACILYYQLRDDPSLENYYVVNYVRKLNKSSNSALSIDRVFANGSASFENYFDLLNDDSFTNGLYSVRTKLENVRPNDSISVSVANISKGYYDFLNAFKRSGSLISNLTGEPINYPSNVNMGYGYFNAYYPQILFFDLNNY